MNIETNDERRCRDDTYDERIESKRATRQHVSNVATITIDVVRSNDKRTQTHMSKRNRNTNVTNENANVDATNVENVVVVDDATTQRTREIDALLNALRNETSSRNKKIIRRTLRDKYDYYISQHRAHASNALIDSIIATTRTNDVMNAS